MFLSPVLLRHPAFREGMRESVPVATGIAAWGLMTGVAMVKSGMSVFEAVLMTLIVYAGSAQLAAIPLLVAGAPAWVIWATAFCVNLRFVVFSLHLREYLMYQPRWRRLVNGYFTGDMCYALFTRRYPQPAQEPAQRLEQEAWLAGNYGLAWAAWCLPSLAGVALGNLIPTHWGLGFAGVLCLLGILCSMTNTRLRAVALAVGAVVAIAAHALPLKLNVVVAIAVAVLACLWLESRRPAPPRERAA